ncbi:unnamed protein product [Cyclocybe aegerita]|uniref:Uncharacterized protein n=1 Tax=Cyclocybe aegerita TaxID=1973307 RepID=A0A8S0WRZ9_CYCAE|nr:unnamed protein product [Cyclocybe aegerita]
MALMQMVADAYSGAQVAWQEENRLRKGKGKENGADNVQDSGPNEAQKRVLDWLVHANYLPPSSLTPPCVEERVPKSTAAIASSPHSGSRQPRTVSLPSLSPKKIWTSLHERRRSLPTLVVSPPTPTEPLPVPFPERKKELNRHSWHSYSHPHSSLHAGLQTSQLTDTRTSNQSSGESRVNQPRPATRIAGYQANLLEHDRRVVLAKTGDSPNLAHTISKPEAATSLDVHQPPTFMSISAQQTAQTFPVPFPRLLPPKALISPPPSRFKEKQRLQAVEKDEERPVTLWTLFAITSLAYVVIFVLLAVFFLFGLCNLLGSSSGREDHD